MELEAGIKLWAEGNDRVCEKLDRLVPKHYKPVRKPVFGVATAVSAATPVVIDINDQPSPGSMWFVHRVGVFGNDAHTPLWNNAAANTNITAGAGSRTLNPGQSLAGFDITFSTAATAAGTITITGVQNFAGGNGSLTYNVPVGAAPISYRFNPPLIANPIGNSITITFSATGAVGNLETYATIPGSTIASAAPQGDVEVYIGFPPDVEQYVASGTAPPNPPLSDLLIYSPFIPFVEKYGQHAQGVHAQEHIYAIAYGIQPGQQLVLSAYVHEYPVEAEEALVIK